MATGANADELSALKAQLEALQARVSQLETQPAPSLPEGTKLLTLRKGQLTSSMNAPLPARERLQEYQGYTIAVTPTADMPAPVSEVTVSGEIRARLLYTDVDIDGTLGDDLDYDADGTTDGGGRDQETVGFDTNYFDVTSRGRLRVDGRTETAIGEVGGTIRLQGTDGGEASMNIAWGYWQMTPNFQLGGGYWDSLAAVQTGWDWNGEPSLVGLDSGPTNQSVSQFRLTYSSGGLTLAASLEDNPWGDIPAVAGAIIFDAGSFLLTAAGIWEDDDTATGPAAVECPAAGVFGDDDGVFCDTEDNWNVGVGAIVRLGDMFRLEGAATMGEGYTGGQYEPFLVRGTFAGTGGAFSTTTLENDAEYWAANAMAVISFHEAMRVELGVGYSEVDHEADELTQDTWGDSVETSLSVGASLFWDPVDQLTLGWGVGWTNKDASDDDAEGDFIVAGFGAWFRF
jgi:hypothetical protein